MDKKVNQTILQALTLDKESPEDTRQHNDDDWLCIICEHVEKNEKDSKKILQHLYFTHHLIIADANDIADLKEYLKFWNKEYKGKKFNKILKDPAKKKYFNYRPKNRRILHDNAMETEA